MAAPIVHSGGVAVFYHATGNFSMDSLQIYVANAVSFHMDSDGQQWFIVG